MTKKTTSPRGGPVQLERHIAGGWVRVADAPGEGRLRGTTTTPDREQRTVRPAPLAARPGGRRARGVCEACGAEAVTRQAITFKSKTLRVAFPTCIGVRLCAACSWITPAKLEPMVGARHAKKLERGG